MCIRDRGKAGLALGMVGLFVLFWPELHSTSAIGRRELVASLGLIGGSFSWALGSVLSKRWQSGMDVFSATGWQVTAAGVANFLFAVVNGDWSRVAWTTRGVSAVPVSYTHLDVYKRQMHPWGWLSQAVCSWMPSSNVMRPLSMS